MDNSKEQRRCYHSPEPLYRWVAGFAKEHRRSPTPAEKVLWDSLRNRQLAGFKFRRQHVIDRYVVDFVCLESKLVVEADGPVHDRPEQQEWDLLRTEKLRQLDFEVLRFPNEAILCSLSSVLETIRQHLRKKLD
ncbi:endonuclease domain-containing protein [Flaviaesturariibacter amylovorans]|uniref:DUF559 domain-containing protein n=1 Tax=Flaviaesturariibacter amylovorans TaxID=1084520 RepID=A0ABP8HGI8_9BACT